MQWVSVHTGIASNNHKIKHLGDVPEAAFPQIWDKLSKKNITSGVWGAMNATKSNSSECLFFLPDPWTHTENAYPDELNALLQPLRYISKNYTNCSKRVLLRSIKNLLKLIWKNDLTRPFARELIFLIKNTLQYRAKPFVFVSFLDFLSSHFFLKYQKRHHPVFSLLFLNSIAHLQHHQWHENNRISLPLQFGFKNIDRILGEIFHLYGPDDLIIVTNALSQKNTSDEDPWILYRQIDQKKFLHTIGIDDATVQEHMTHDAHLFFPSAESTQKAYALLKSAKVGSSPFFHIEIYPDNPHKLFYRIQFTDPVSKEATFNVPGKSFPFFDLFKAIVKRTGRHIQKGTLFANQPVFSNELMNHEIQEQIIKFCDQNIQKTELVSPQSR